MIVSELNVHMPVVELIILEGDLKLPQALGHEAGAMVKIELVLLPTIDVEELQTLQCVHMPLDQPERVMIEPLVPDLFPQFSQSAAGGGGAGFLGPLPGIQFDTAGNTPTVPDQQITITFDVLPAFFATTAGGSATWSGVSCP